jgi:hypothetical protein
MSERLLLGLMWQDVPEYLQDEAVKKFGAQEIDRLQLSKF